MNYPTFTIKNRRIGKGYPTFIIAEISANHEGDFEKTVKLIQEIAKSGADAVKLQTYTPSSLTIDSDKKWFRVTGTDIPSSWKHKTMYELYKKGAMPWEWQPKLKKVAEDCGLIFFSTPFDEDAVNFLERMNVPCYKVASYEINHIPLLKKIAATKKPVILSRGMATISDISLALKTLRGNGVKDIALLHCVSAYPAKSEDMNLATIPDIRTRFKVVSGLSDHTLGIEVPIIAAALGASIIEKHVTWKRKESGLDTSFSLTPNELRKLVASVRHLEQIIGTPHYGTSGKRETKERMARRSIFVVKDMKKGEEFTKENIHVIRPGYGLHPKEYEQVLGKIASSDIEAGTPLGKRNIK